MKNELIPEFGNFEKNYSVLIFSSVEDIQNNNPRRLKFEFLSGAQKYAEMLSTSNRFLSIQVLNHEGQIYCEYENWP